MATEKDQERIDNIIKFWFGRVEKTVIPTENRARIWFGEDPRVDAEIKANYGQDLKKAINQKYANWAETSRGQLALIIVLDQFSRHIYRHTPESFAQDEQALKICLTGMAKEDDHVLSLIERSFYYFPLLHSEHLGYQEQSIRAYSVLTELAFVETKAVYESFLKFANHHYMIIKRFGRFPHRNAILGRESTAEEIAFLKETEQT